MNFGKLAGIAVFIAVCRPEMASAEPLEPLAAKIVVTEHENPAVKVSGTSVAGIMFAGVASTEERPSLSTYIRQDMAGGQVCMHAVSLDGIYETVYSYDVPGELGNASVLPLQYPTKFPKRVGNDPGTDLAVLLTPGSCDDDPDRFLVGYWNTAAQQDRPPVILMLNSLGADEVFVFLGSDLSADPIDCSPVFLDSPRAYDHICELPADAETNGDELLVEINVVRSGVRDPAKTIKLVVAPS